jgi:hypothetical protein
VGFDVLTTCQPSTVWCSRERLPAAAAQPVKARESCSATDYYYYFSYNICIVSNVVGADSDLEGFGYGPREGKNLLSWRV